MRSNTIAFNVGIFIIRLGLAFIFLIGVFICLFWYILTASINSGIGIGLDEVTITPQMELDFYSELLFYWAVSVPCFVDVVLGFWCTVLAKREGIFSSRLAKTFFKMALILFIASIVFLIGTVYFWILRFDWNQLTMTYCVVGVLGIAISGVLYVVYRYILRASKLKEENNSIL